MLGKITTKRANSGPLSHSNVLLSILPAVLLRKLTQAPAVKALQAMKFDFPHEIHCWTIKLKPEIEKEVNYVFLPFPTVAKQASTLSPFLRIQHGDILKVASIASI